jgi:hypothetical protein
MQYRFISLMQKEAEQAISNLLTEGWELYGFPVVAAAGAGSEKGAIQNMATNPKGPPQPVVISIPEIQFRLHAYQALIKKD